MQSLCICLQQLSPKPFTALKEFIRARNRNVTSAADKWKLSLALLLQKGVCYSQKHVFRKSHICLLGYLCAYSIVEEKPFLVAASEVDASSHESGENSTYTDDTFNAV